MTDLNRRGWALGVGLGVVALGGGAWLRSRHAPLSPVADLDVDVTPAAGGVASSGAAIAASPLPFALTTLDGKTLAAADIRGRAVVLNFWAPWCPPCVREMPEIDRFARSAAGKDTLVIGLAIDEAPAVHRFVAEHPISFPVSVLGYAGLSWVRKLGNDSGALPFSAVFDRRGRLVHRKLGPTSAAELSGWAQSSST
jgi:thiol-disulfide isomerase/thioredoxin